MQALFGRDAQLTRSGLVVGCPPPDGLRPQGFTPVLLCTPDPTLLWSPRHCPVCSLLLGVCFVLGPDSFQLITLIMLLRDFVNCFLPGWIYRQPIIWDDLLPPAPPSHLPSPGRAHGRHPHHRADAVQQVVQCICTQYFDCLSSRYALVLGGFGPGYTELQEVEVVDTINLRASLHTECQRLWPIKNDILPFVIIFSIITATPVLSCQRLWNTAQLALGLWRQFLQHLQGLQSQWGGGVFLHMLQHYCQVSWRCVRTGWVCRWQGDSSSILFWNRNVKISSFSCWPWR